MLSRSDVRKLAQAARNGWDTSVERRQQAVREVQEVLDSATASERLVEAALDAMNAFKSAGWA